MKVLIVDDSEDALRLARRRLEPEGVDIVCAGSGKEGLRVARQEKPDLVLLDLNMPDISGSEVCRLLKGDPELAPIPVIFLSGSGSAEDKVRGLDLGAVDYVTKPFDAYELRARVRAALRTKHLQDLLVEHARIDLVTGLPNRRALMDNLQHELARLRRHGGVLSFIMADIDHFKRINDSLGHTTGDQLLRLAAAAVADQCRQTDLAGRYGGDEFAVLVPDENAAAAEYVAERCRQAVQQVRIEVRGKRVTTTASFGVAQADAHRCSQELIERADSALYDAKAAGRNAVRVAK